MMNIQIQTTSRCNANCVFCPYAESWQKKHPGRMTLELFQTILDEISVFTPAKVCMYLMNEPLMDPRIYDWIMLVRSRIPSALIEISTNAACLTARNAARLIEVIEGHPHEVWVSHHGTSREMVEAVMEGIDYDRTVGNIIGFLKEAGGRINVRIQGAGHPRVPQVLDGIKLFDAAEYNTYWTRIFSENDVQIKNVGIHWFTFHDRAGTIQRHERDANINNYGVVRQIDPSHPFSCPRVDEWLHIMWDGRLRLCCMDYHGEVELPLVQNGIGRYFSSPEYRRIKGMVSGKIESGPYFICKRCISPGG